MIHLRSLSVLQAPGLPNGVELPSLGAGLNLVLGPNASGKSTLVRAFLEILWPDGRSDEIRARTVLETGGGPAAATLRYGGVQWDPDRPALPSSELRTLLALDLLSLLEGSTTDEQFSRRVAVELMAGYDLDAAQASLQVPAPRVGQLQNTLKAARNELHRLERETAALARREKELETLRRKREDADRARELETLAREAARLAGIRTQIEGLQSRIANLPAGLDRLHGGESEELERLGKTLAAARDRLQDLTRRLERARAEQEALRLPDQRPDPLEVTAWRQRVMELDAASRQIESSRGDLAEVRSRVAAARSALGSWEPPAAGLPVEALDRIEGALDQREELQARLREHQAAVEYWSSQAGPEAAAATHRLALGIDALRSWLRSVPLEGIPAWPGWLALALGGVTVLGRWLPAIQPLPPAGMEWLLAAGTLLLGGGCGYLLTLAVARSRTGGTRSAEARNRAAEAGVAPEHWEESSALERLRRAEEERDSLLLAERAAQRAADALQRVERTREELAAAEARVRDLAASLGVARELPGLGLMEAARLIEHWVKARDEVAGLEGRIAAAESSLQGGLERLGAWLEPFGLPRPEDAAAATAVVEDLAGRLNKLQEITARLAETESDLDSAETEHDAARSNLGGFWERIGLGEGEELELLHRLEALPEYERLTGELTELRGATASLEAELAEKGAWEHLGLRPDSFTEHRAGELERAFSEEAADYSRLVKEITEIEQAIRQMEGGISLEDARAAVERATRELAKHRDRAMEATLVHFLIRRAGEAQRREHAPRVLERAQRRFAAFTRHAFQLDVGADRALRAVDTRTGEARSLEQLSDGTRIHLLLAARLAALEEAEGAAGPLPLFLDEALSTTDPGRFREIARALLALVQDGRQLVYLTADPAEIEQWREACREAGVEPPEPLWLGTPSRSVEGWIAVPSLDAGTVPRVPDPGNADAASYARTLGVPAPDPWRPAGSWPVLHLLPDHLTTVQKLLRLGFSEVGPLARTLATGGLKKTLEAGEYALLKARTALFLAAMELRARGRGRPIRWEDVKASGAVSTRFEEQVRSLVETEGRDPTAFLQAVRQMPRFRSEKADDLENHLRDMGVLPDESILETDDIVGLALDRCLPELELAKLDDDAAAYLRSVLKMLNR